MDTYRIPLVWQMYGHCDVDANSLEDAIEIALGPDTPLPDGFYVEDSVAVDYEVLELDQDKKRLASSLTPSTICPARSARARK